MSHVWIWHMWRSHMWFPHRCHVTHMNESCHTCERLECDFHTHEWFVSLIRMIQSYFTYHVKKYPWVTSHISMGFVTHINESRHTYQRVRSQVWISHGRHKQRRRTGVKEIIRVNIFILTCVRAHMWRFFYFHVGTEAAQSIKTQRVVTMMIRFHHQSHRTQTHAHIRVSAYVWDFVFPHMCVSICVTFSRVLFFQETMHGHHDGWQFTTVITASAHQ